MDQLWECIASRRPFIELDTPKAKTKKERGKNPQILVLDLEKITALVQLYDELGIDVLDDHTLERPLVEPGQYRASHFKGLPSNSR